MKFLISLEWFEYRATYHNLKQEDALNALTLEDLDHLWIPYVIYANTDNNEAVSIDPTVKTSAFLTREGDYVMSGIEVADEIMIFKGEENRLTLTQTYSKVFQCIYQIHWFPFDTQVCY